MSDKKPDAKPEAEGKPAAGAEAGKGGSEGGLKSWLPLIVTIVLMPVLAFATTKFLILPKVVQAREGAAGEEGHEEEAAGESGGHGEKKDGGHDAPKESKDHGKAKEKEPAKDAHGKSTGKKKQSFPVTKVIVNVAGSMGTRYLMTSFTLVGTANDFKGVLEENKDQLLDLANSAMASKTISDLEKPGARNQLRAELISIFNNALGNNLVQEIYFTEFAVQ